MGCHRVPMSEEVFCKASKSPNIRLTDETQSRPHLTSLGLKLLSITASVTLALGLVQAFGEHRTSYCWGAKTEEELSLVYFGCVSMLLRTVLAHVGAVCRLNNEAWGTDSLNQDFHDSHCLFPPIVGFQMLSWVNFTFFMSEWAGSKWKSNEFQTLKYTLAWKSLLRWNRTEEMRNLNINTDVKNVNCPNEQYDQETTT